MMETVVDFSTIVKMFLANLCKRNDAIVVKWPLCKKKGSKEKRKQTYSSFNCVRLPNIPAGKLWILFSDNDL